jgi:4-amino-4-deoxy-L-arabinose transferase-like glycosyltransferase
MIPVYPFSGRTSRFLIPLLFFTAVCVLQVLPVLSTVHLFDWDEINFAESAREMLVTGDFSIVRIGFLPFWEKPPLFIWMQAGSMYLFGINEFAARFPNFLASVITLMALYLIGTNLRSSRFGFTWALLYFGSLLPNLYFHSGIIDPWYNLFSFLCFYFFLEARGRASFIVLSGFFWG